MTMTRHFTVHYRRLLRDGAIAANGVTLSQAIAGALHSPHPDGGRYIDNWKYRLTLSEDRNQNRLFNHVHVDPQSAFGTLCAFTPGDMQALIETGPNQDATTLSISEENAPGGNDYLTGIVYWLVIGDHCYIVQNIAVRAKALEEYLTWFLRKTGIINQIDEIILQSAFNVSAADIDEVKSIEIGGLATEPVAEPPENLGISKRERIVEERRSLAEIGTIWSKAKRIVEEIFGSIEAERIFESVPPNAALDVKVNIGYRATRRHIDRVFMNELAIGLRNIEDGELGIRTKDGKIRGDKTWLQTSMPFKKIRNKGILLDLKHVREQLFEVHRRFLADGRID